MRMRNKINLPILAMIAIWDIKGDFWSSQRISREISGKVYRISCYMMGLMTLRKPHVLRKA